MRLPFATNSISGILSLAGMIVCLGMLAILGRVWSATTDLRRAMDESAQYTIAMRNHLQSDKVHRALMTVTLRAQQASRSGDQGEARAIRSDLDAQMDELREVQERTVSLRLNGEVADELRSVQQNYVDYVEMVREIVALSDGQSDAVAARMPGFRTLFQAMAQDNARISDMLEARVHASGEHVSETLSNLLLQLAMGVAGALLLTALLVWHLRKRIVEPLARISSDLKSTEATDLSEDKARTDEIGELARSVDIFRGASEQVRMSDQARLEAERRANAEAERLHALANKASALEQRTLGIVGQVIATATELNQVADSLADNASRSREETTSAAGAAEQTLGGVLAIAEATDELLVSINEVTGRIREVARSGEEARAIASSTGTTIAQLDDMARRIASFTDRIGQIAQRSHLLALNATIEAAHAGHAGGGFAIVADEVKQLSTQTAAAVKEIDEQIGGIVAITRDATASLSAMSRAIADLGGATASIAAAADQQSLATAEIGRTLEQSSSGTEVMRRNLQLVEGQVSNTATSAQMVREATRLLDSQAAELRREMEAFISRTKAA